MCSFKHYMYFSFKLFASHIIIVILIPKSFLICVIVIESRRHSDELQSNWTNSFFVAAASFCKKVQHFFKVVKDALLPENADNVKYFL